jgi:hypothetical protein
MLLICLRPFPFQLSRVYILSGSRHVIVDCAPYMSSRDGTTQNGRRAFLVAPFVSIVLAGEVRIDITCLLANCFKYSASLFASSTSS